MTPAMKGAAPTGLRQLRRKGREPLPVVLLLVLTLSSALAGPPSKPWAPRNLLQAERYDDSYDGDVLEQDRVYPNDIIDEVVRSDGLDVDGGGEDAILPQNIGAIKEKKAPSGFLGVGGRRLEGGGLYADADASATQKRKTYGFLGVRGKKAPLGFVGMRGKKAPSGFLGVRGKKEVPQNLEELLKALSHRYDGQQSRSYKRGSPFGFIGMRGRRTESFGDELGRGTELGGLGDERGAAQKRVPPRYGFIGLRG